MAATKQSILDYGLSVGNRLTLRPDDYLDDYWIIAGRNEFDAANCSTEQLLQFAHAVINALEA